MFQRALLSRVFLGLPLLGLLTGCNTVVLNPSGDIALQQRDLLIAATALMLVIIIPVMVLIVFFSWRYRSSNKAARYEPDWDHSTQLELAIWGAPLVIIIFLGLITWTGTHLLDPYRKLSRVSHQQPIAADVTPLEVQVVALDWKWLFIYPQYGIATVNELAAPVDRPIDFQITASSVMNSFYIPALAGQIYAMPAMQTKLHAVINEEGDYEGFSANYSGAGFSGMKFRFHGIDTGAFYQWVKKVKAGGGALDRDAYLKLEAPSEDVPVTYFNGVQDGLYHAILNLCVQPGKMCMDEMMHIDAKGGAGVAGIYNVRPLEYDKYGRRGSMMASAFGPLPSYVAAICTTDNPRGEAVKQSKPALPRALSGTGREAAETFRLPLQQTSARAGQLKPIF